ncbi:MAG: inositol monophosphatase [Candidatus Krumholzibacteria bacterium]|nr:inositol monophosphatase [Candidatus Krumholzibacteria bacterium]
MRQRIEVAREAILSAGSLIRETFGREISGQVEEKDRNDFVTQSDRLSEKMISETLLRAFPEIGILGEENAERMDDDEYWIIDPLDGTTNFIHGYPSIGLSVALVRESEVVLGLVFDPLREELFEASRGCGAFCNKRKIHVSGAGSLQESLLGTGFPFKAQQHLESYIESFKELFSSCRGVRRAGAAVLDLSHVAAGRLDGFWELHLKPWDMAAGALLVREAGGLVTDLFGGSSFLSAGNIVAGNRSIHGKMLETTERVFDREKVADLACDLIDM